MVSVAEALERIKQDPRGAIAPSVLEGVCREMGLEWAQTPLTPPDFDELSRVVTLGLLARQVLGGNVSNPELLRQAGLASAVSSAERG
jgi:hypothetical protein